MLLLSLTLASWAQAKQSYSVIKSTGSKSWATENHGVHFSLTQIQPQQGQAFYSNRGFNLKHIDDFIQSCVFMTVIRNDNPTHSMQYRLKDWKVSHNHQPHALIFVDDWLKKLATRNINKASLIAFKWAQFPTEQEYQAGGDWNQGMLSIGLAAKQTFNITATWTMNGKLYHSTLTGVECAQ